MRSSTRAEVRSCRGVFASATLRGRKAEHVDDALYASLCRTMRVLCLEVQATQSPSGPLLLEWQSWARAFVAGLYHRKGAVRAALSAGWEAILLEMDDPEAGQFGHAAADLAWAAVHLAEGEHEMAEALAHAARQRVLALVGAAAVAQTGAPAGSRATHRGAAIERQADPATHARLLIRTVRPDHGSADDGVLRGDERQRLLALRVRQGQAWDGSLIR